jgi:ABC-type uncharacterized transport system ATPase subunit
MRTVMAPVITSQEAVFRSEVAELASLTKNYGPRRALDRIDLAVGRGEILALLGPNGAGKTTAVKLLLGLLNSDGGAVRVFGNDPREARNRQRTGAMLQVARVRETLRAPTHLDRSGRAQFRIAERRIGRGILSVDRELPWEVSKRVLPQRQVCIGVTRWSPSMVCPPPEKQRLNWNHYFQPENLQPENLR